MTKTEKRCFRRLESSLKVELGVFDKNGAVIGSDSAITLNVSRTGLLIRTGIDIPLEADVTILIDISGKNIHLKCKCMYCHKPDEAYFEAGMHIRKIKDSELPLYLELIQKLENEDEDVINLRTQALNLDNLVSRIAAEHKIVIQFIVTIENMLAKEEPETEQLYTIMSLMNKDSRTHFKIEEVLFFKVAKEFLPNSSREIIAKLTLEHRIFLKEFDDILKSLKLRIDNRDSLSHIFSERISNFMESVKQHARIELTELFPQIEENPKAKQAIFKKINDLTGA